MTVKNHAACCCVAMLIWPVEGRPRMCALAAVATDLLRPMLLTAPFTPWHREHHIAIITRCDVKLAQSH